MQKEFWLGLIFGALIMLGFFGSLVALMRFEISVNAVAELAANLAVVVGGIAAGAAAVFAGMALSHYKKGHDYQAHQTMFANVQYAIEGLSLAWHELSSCFEDSLNPARPLEDNPSTLLPSLINNYQNSIEALKEAETRLIMSFPKYAKLRAKTSGVYFSMAILHQKYAQAAAFRNVPKEERERLEAVIQQKMLSLAEAVYEAMGHKDVELYDFD